MKYVLVIYFLYESVVIFLMWWFLKVDKSPEGYTPLHYAAEASQTEIVKLLLEKGAQPNAKYETPLNTQLARN